MLNIVEKAPKISRFNAISCSSCSSGCYFCLSIISKDSICDFDDEGMTAICPYCGLDALLPNITDLEILTLCQSRWFPIPTSGEFYDSF